MHFNNLLKKKLHITRLRKFLRKNPCIILYHTQEGQQLRRLPPVVEYKGNVLFLTNAKQIRHPTGLAMCHDNKGRANEIEDFIGHNAINSREKQQISPENLLNSNAATLSVMGAAAGNTYLVGCKSLKEMQRILLDCVATNCICLGGIYDNCYLDYADMYRFAHLKETPQSLLNVLSGGTYSLVQAAAVPQTKFLHLLGITVASKAST